MVKVGDKVKILVDNPVGTTERKGAILEVTRLDGHGFYVNSSDGLKEWSFIPANIETNLIEIIPYDPEEIFAPVPYIMNKNLENGIEYSGKGTKHDQGKPPIHMIPEVAIIGMAEGFAYGAKKYDRFNYRKGLDYTRLTDSLMRHTLAFLMGEDTDPESGLHHTKLMLANAAMLEFMRVNRPEHDDRYRGEDND